MKAFLSHATSDKEFVRAVAKELGRQFCLFDEQAFATGVEFKESIANGLDESSIFVLFASRSALDSIWVNLEIEEAWYRRLHQVLPRSLVYVIDSSIDHSQIPEWLHRAQVKRENVPKVIARDIRQHLDDLLRERQHSYFVGRLDDIAQLQRALTPLDGQPSPHAVFVSGLPGIGRRSLVRQTAPTTLALRKLTEVRVGEGDSINDLCTKVADQIEPWATKEGFERIVREIQALPAAAALERLMVNLRSLTNSGALCVFIDEGGILDQEGYIRDHVKAILGSVAPNDDAYLFLVSHRKPHMPDGTQIPVVHLQPLQIDDRKRLLLRLADHANVRVSVAELSELADYIAGYPPAAYFAVQQVKDYGIDLVMRDKRRLVEFRSSVFMRHLSRVALSEHERDLVRLLALYSPLPLAVIATVQSLELSVLHANIVRLIDLALLTTTNEGYYRIADPVAEAAIKAFGYPREEDHKALATVLARFLTDAELDAARLELSRVLFRAARLAHDEALTRTTVHLADDLITLTETSYHAEQYDDTVKVGLAALDQRPESNTARGYLIRALIQEERWTQAEEQLHEFRKHAPLRDVYFLAGFLYRKRGNIPQAIEAYLEAVSLGRTGVAVNRELAVCYMLSGNLERANDHLQAILPKNLDNRFVLDLWVQIATRRGDRDEANAALERLELVDEERYFLHRVSRVELAFGNIPKALAAARRAASSVPYPPLAVLAQFVYCLIASGLTDEAEDTLNAIDRRFAVRRDVRTGLRCRLKIAEMRFADALDLSERIENKNTAFYKRIRRDALQGELEASALKDAVRESYTRELESLNHELSEAPDAAMLTLELDEL